MLSNESTIDQPRFTLQTSPLTNQTPNFGSPRTDERSSCCSCGSGGAYCCCESDFYDQTVNTAHECWKETYGQAPLPLIEEPEDDSCWLSCFRRPKRRSLPAYVKSEHEYQRNYTDEQRPRKVQPVETLKPREGNHIEIGYDYPVPYEEQVEQDYVRPRIVIRDVPWPVQIPHVIP